MARATQKTSGLAAPRGTRPLRAQDVGAPSKDISRQTVSQLRELQRLAFATISHPLTPGFDTQKHFRDGRPMRDVAKTFIKPNDRLTSLERLSIYNRQYWMRLMDCLWDDYPGLRAILGPRKFEKLRIAYLSKYPSQSFTLRNLGSRLVQFLEEEPQYISTHDAMCLDMARFEWAQIVAFDGEAKPALSVDDLLGQDPAKLRLSLQPYMTLLEMGYALDDYVAAVKKRDAAMRSEASNAMEADHAEKRRKTIRLPRPGKIFLAVHRHDNDLYYKRLDVAEYRILSALRDGVTLADACAAAVEAEPEREIDWPASIKTWFSAWAETGWFCRRMK
jgi:hypothetical protein